MRKRDFPQILFGSAFITRGLVCTIMAYYNNALYYFYVCARCYKFIFLDLNVTVLEPIVETCRKRRVKPIQLEFTPTWIYPRTKHHSSYIRMRVRILGSIRGRG